MTTVKQLTGSGDGFIIEAKSANDVDVVMRYKDITTFEIIKKNGTVCAIRIAQSSDNTVVYVDNFSSVEVMKEFTDKMDERTKDVDCGGFIINL